MSAEGRLCGADWVHGTAAERRGTGMGERGNTHRILVWTQVGGGVIERHKRKYEDNTKTD